MLKGTYPSWNMWSKSMRTCPLSQDTGIFSDVHNCTTDMKWSNKLNCFNFWQYQPKLLPWNDLLSTRMHSSRMCTAHFSGHLYWWRCASGLGVPQSSFTTPHSPKPFNRHPIHHNHSPHTTFTTTSLHHSLPSPHPLRNPSLHHTSTPPHTPSLYPPTPYTPFPFTTPLHHTFPTPPKWLTLTSDIITLPQTSFVGKKALLQAYMIQFKCVSIGKMKCNDITTSVQMVLLIFGKIWYIL